MVTSNEAEFVLDEKAIKAKPRFEKQSLKRFFAISADFAGNSPSALTITIEKK
jgi:hypothetical protein